MDPKLRAAVWKLIRPTHWIKNGFILSPLLVSAVFGFQELTQAVIAVAIFCAAASSVYVWNDLLDQDRDRLHPTKRERPIAAGIISTRLAWIIALCLASIAIVATRLFLPEISVPLIAYFALNIAYTLKLKHVVLIDIFAVAANYIIRIVAGSLAIHQPITPWMTVLGTLLALFLALGKRRGERMECGDTAGDHRSTLNEYSPKFLDRLLLITTPTIIAAYIIYTLSASLAERVQSTWMPLTIPFVLYGMFRYFYLMYQKGSGQSPTLTLLKDRPLFIAVCCWAIAILLIRVFHAYL